MYLQEINEENRFTHCFIFRNFHSVHFDAQNEFLKE